jgi:hypothetical protein
MLNIQSGQLCEALIALNLGNLVSNSHELWVIAKLIRLFLKSNNKVHLHQYGTYSIQWNQLNRRSHLDWRNLALDRE